MPSLAGTFRRASSDSSSSTDQSDDTRATTPETYEPCSCLTHLVMTTIPDSVTLNALFDSKAKDGSMGLCLFTRPSDGTESASRAFVAEYLGLRCPHWSTGSEKSSVFVECVAPLNYKPLPKCSTIASHERLFSLAGLRTILSMTSKDGRYAYYVIERPPIVFPNVSDTPSLLNEERQNNIPTIAEWERVWKMWDLITLEMIPQDMLHQKPIDLRHKCLFYIGHIPTFLDMLLCKAIGGGPSEPTHFWNIFERGIDPHVDDPNHCHNHSEVPERDEDWPTLETILFFRDNVRKRLTNLYEELHAGKRDLTRNIARTLVMCIEHEGFHIETLLYMLFQRGGRGTLPPQGFTIPQWNVLKNQWDSVPLPASPTITIPATTITMGHDDSEADDVDPTMPLLEHTYGWDNESPARAVKVKSFRADWRPITNGQFLEFLTGDGKGKVEVPKTWVDKTGEFHVQTIYGPVPMSIAHSWPCLTAYDDLEAYAQSKGGRLPSEPELRIFLDQYNDTHAEGGNMGFRNWHPLPATAGLASKSGKGSNGGVWEWTSTKLANHAGLVPTKLFTGYSVDFFDEKHHVVLGASYATIPRLADRGTVRNFYQHNYPYPWVGARVVYDL
ncbi:C-type lectin protein [Flagelloscypha sp. PMI_526]|nr:C-type lectin protein [Flagelloscypha sp. PMI_526]